MHVAESAYATASIPVSHDVYGAIRRAILRLDLQPGAAISENSLAGDLRVSRTPVREALQRLERERLVFIFPQRGTIVAPLDLQEIQAAYFVRAALECAAATEAAKRCEAADVVRLTREIEVQRAAIAAGDFDRFFESNDLFHRDLMAIAGVPRAWNVVQGAKVHLDRARVAHLTMAGDYPLAPIVAEHEALVAAISHGAAQDAERTMRAHVEKILHRVARLRELRPELFELPPEMASAARSVSASASARKRTRGGESARTSERETGVGKAQESPSRRSA